MEPQEGIVWKHPNTRVAYVAQHAFHHVEQVRIHADCIWCWSRSKHVYAKQIADSALL